MNSSREIKTIGICGVGQMGAAAAVCFQRAGYRVLAWDKDPGALESLPGKAAELGAWLDTFSGPALQPGGRLEICTAPEALDEEADAILDCIREDMTQKVELLTRFARGRERQILFLTTTSGLSITQLGRRSGCSRLLVGTHFWNPPHLMPLVEVIRGEDTPDVVVEKTCQLITSIDKRPVRVNRDVPGFIGNRLLHALWREAISLIEEGIASPEDVDQVARLTFGLRMPVMGPLENMDLVGLDLIERIHEYLLEDLADNHGPADILTENVQQGRLGVKSGRGFYDWSSRRPATLIERRNQQIIHQLRFLQQLDEETNSP